MSSPNAKTFYSLIERGMIRIHRKLSHERRVSELAAAIAPLVDEGSSVLDLGCGDMAILARLRALRSLRRSVGADVWEPQIDPPEGCEYRTIVDGESLPWLDDEFDTVIVVDTLHHVRDPRWALAEALRVGRRVIVKDHFEYGPWSRLVLRVLDFLGNHAYGVNVPDRYFTRESFARIAGEVAPGGSLRFESGLSLYRHLPGAGIFLSPKLQFLSVLTAGPGAGAGERGPS